MGVDHRTIGEKISDAVAHFGGSWKFILIFSAFLSAWLAVNSHPSLNFLSFDSPPFILLNLILSFIAAFQAPFIMMSQNRSEAKQDEAYRALFSELKELVEQNIELEQHVAGMIHDVSVKMDGHLSAAKG